MRGRILMAAALTLSGFGLGMPAAMAGGDDGGGDPGDSRFTCEATSARVQTPVLDLVSTQANPGGDPCVDQFAQVLGAKLPGGLAPAILTANVLTAQTDADPGDEPGAQSDAAAAKVGLKLGSSALTVDALRARATAHCDNGEAVLAGDSEVVGLNGRTEIITKPVKITDPANPLLNIWLNEQTVEDDGEGNRVLTQRALHVFGLTALGLPVDVVVGEAVADVHGDPCGETPPPPPPECSDGMDNDGDKAIDHPDDPGCTSPEDDDESDEKK